MKKPALNCITKISKENLGRIEALKISGYEPNDYIISLGLNLLLQNRSILHKSAQAKVKLARTTKISKVTLGKIESLKISGYEPNDFIIGKALDLLENERKK
jgi:hypothetical protein